MMLIIILLLTVNELDFSETIAVQIIGTLAVLNAVVSHMAVAWEGKLKTVQQGSLSSFNLYSLNY
jgi:hypothetical protein